MERLARYSFVTLATALVCAFSASAASARDFNCDASAIRLTLGSSATVEPVTANRGSATCKNVGSPVSITTTNVSAGVLVAQTSVPSQREADATGGLSQLTVGLGALSGIPNPTQQAINALQPITIPTLPPLPPSITIDLRPAVQAVVNNLLSGNLLDLQGSVANAKATCDGGTPQLSGSTTVLGLKVLGLTIPTDAAVNQALTLYNGQTIDPKSLDLSKIAISPDITDPTLTALVQAAIKPVIDNLPPITLPASLINLSITPSSQQIADGGLTQRGLQISLGLGGNNVLSAVVGEARVSVDSVKCTTQTPAGLVAPLNTVSKQALSCSTRRLALIDVLDKGNHVALYGAADQRLAGQRIAIRSLADNKIVARPVVSKAGLFHATAPLPPQRWRYTNRARYIAIHGNDRSLNLKLHRRMVFTTVTSRKGKVLLSGVVTRPWTRPVSSILVRQRLTCHKQVVVARLHPDAQGRFQVRLKVPKHGDVGVYRATTMVGYPDGPDFRTYTLPGLVRFAR